MPFGFRQQEAEECRIGRARGQDDGLRAEGRRVREQQSEQRECRGIGGTLRDNPCALAVDADARRIELAHRRCCTRPVCPAGAEAASGVQGGWRRQRHAAVSIAPARRGAALRRTRLLRGEGGAGRSQWTAKPIASSSKPFQGARLRLGAVTKMSAAMAIKLRTGQVTLEQRAAALAMSNKLIAGRFMMLPVTLGQFAGTGVIADVIYLHF